jgi:uncharacterized protein DUF4105
VRLLGLLCLGLLLCGSATWGVVALYYSNHESPALRTSLAAAFAVVSLVSLAGFVLPQWRWYALAAYAIVFALVLWRWSGTEPSNDRDWQPEGAHLAWADAADDRVTLHSIRNFDYRTETDFTPAYYDKTFDLRQLDSVDLITVYWMGPAIAHVFLSFGFAGKDYVAISIEARKERGEAYSSVAGFFRGYELHYVVADERDVIRVRTNYRRNPPEDVHLYRLHGAKEDARRLFLEYLHEINSLRERPEFYNTLLTNCTTNIWLHSRVVPERPPFSWRILVSGYVPELLYDHGRLDTSLPFAELRQRSRINELAMAADKAADFSRRIRAGLPSEKSGDS